MVMMTMTMRKIVLGNDNSDDGGNTKYGLIIHMMVTMPIPIKVRIGGVRWLGLLHC